MVAAGHASTNAQVVALGKAAKAFTEPPWLFSHVNGSAALTAPSTSRGQTTGAQVCGWFRKQARMLRRFKRQE
jgi:hypothetical protein